MKKLPVLLAGMVLGAGVTLLAVFLLMPGMMITTHKSPYKGVDETCDQLVSAVKKAGWSVPAVRSLNKSMEKQGIQMDRQVRIVELCKADYARDILGTNPEVSTLMPCAWGVYEGADGETYISGMNMGLMGKMFGGNIAKVMGGSVSRDEETMMGMFQKGS